MENIIKEKLEIDTINEPMKTYNRNEIFKSTLDYFNGDELATNTWINKYALKDSYDNIYELNPNDTHKRLAKEIHRIESKYKNPLNYELILSLLENFKYLIPGGGSLTGIGNEFQVASISNCFVVGNKYDSYGSIFRTDEEQTQLMKRRGGVGHDLSHLRPAGTPVKNSALTSTGIVPFMERYSNSTREVAQDGRRGALMLSLSIKHPDAEKFIDAKLEQGKVTGANISVKMTDDFMNAVINDKPFTQQYPVYTEKPSTSKEIDSKRLWNKIVHNVWKSAEPGVLFWDKIISESPADCYADQGFATVSTNPCLSGEVLISVADGRNAITIKQLAEEGNDVPVYSVDKDNKLCIKMMRNPRITGYNQQLYKVTIEDGITYKVTGNHKFILKDGREIEARDLKRGDSLSVMSKYKNDNKPKSNVYSILMYDGNRIGEHRLIAPYYNEKQLELNEVVHHKDYNGLNNRPENLQIMTKEEHDNLHSFDMMGDKNPMVKMKQYPDKVKEYSNRMSEVTSGLTNGNAYNVTNDEIINHAINLTKKLNRRFSNREWVTYANEFKIPKTFSNFRLQELSGVTALSKYVALNLGLEMIDQDPRLIRTHQKMLSLGYNSKIEDNEIFVEKFCEHCNNSFWVNHRHREISFCSISCSNKFSSNNVDSNIKRTNTINKIFEEKSKIIKDNQLRIYKDLQFNLGTSPKLKDWEIECKKNKIPVRFKSKHSFKSYSDLIENSKFYNHKVISVELDGVENVYNGTVDDTHTYFITDNNNKINVLTRNCGEIPLCPYDSCRLLAINLYSYVIDPFTPDAYFDFELFKEHVQYGQRFMDDIIDLEIEKIETIINKIKTDSEPDSVKQTELNLWENVKRMAILGRRTGLGITSEGDMLAAMGYRYGSVEGIDFAVKVQTILATEAYKASIIMGEERGAFEVFNIEKEIQNPFLNRVIFNNPDMDDKYREQHSKTGRRNIALLTIAPTGSVSIMTQTTSGIEPAFGIKYKRKRKINPNDKGVNLDNIEYDKQGDAFEKYNVYHHGFVKWANINGYDLRDLSDENYDKLYEISPYYKSTSADIDWVLKVSMQGKVQQWIDHSISVTVNLPNEATEEMVSDVYMTAWKCGCKGITAYREGSREGILVSDKHQQKVDNPFKEINVPKRPKVLECDVIHFSNKGEKWVGVLGLVHDRPIEIFTGKWDSFMIPLSIEQGNIIKCKENGATRYDFQYVDSDGYKCTMEGLNRAFNREYHNYARLISGVLRQGMPLIYVHELVEGIKLEDGDSISDWKSGVKRLIKKHIKDGVKTKDICPDCGNNLIFAEKCKKCTNCGYSACG